MEITIEIGPVLASIFGVAIAAAVICIMYYIGNRYEE